MRLISSPQINFKPCVYGLVDPNEPGHVRYVGLARQPNRPFSHAQEARRSSRSSWKLNWIRSIQAVGREPAVIVLEELSFGRLSSSNASSGLLGFVESSYIASLKSIGHRLTNLTAGGEGLIDPAQEVRDKISKSQSAAMAPLEMRKRISDKQKIRLANRSTEEKEKHRQVARAYRPSDDAKKKIGERSKECWADPQYRSKHIEAIKAKTSTSAWKSEQSERIKTSWLGPKGDVRRARWASPEKRAEQSKRMKEFYAEKRNKVSK